ncbi:MAG: UDP-N-acetylglucosamine 2-epimerase (non-hydrolyzing) [Candidatus Eisenbacteria bacterium]
MIEILSVFGTRPEAIKMAPLLAELGRRSDVMSSRVCVTAQHREMLDQVLEVFGIVPDIDLDIMTDNQSPGRVTGAVLESLDGVLTERPPDLVLVHGDTTTTMAASLAAFYHKIPVGHVEAGLRTGCRYYPFPEEMNRVVTDAVATLHFAPTARAAENLLASGVSKKSITVTGNTVIDALLDVAGRSYDDESGAPTGGRVVLVTAHRRENHGAPLENICHALRDIADAFPDVHIVYPVHLNPNVQRVARHVLGDHERVLLLEPMSYVSIVRVMKESFLVVTDSGGLQEEAPSLGKPVLVLRNETERPEAVEAGTVRLVGTDRDRIVEHMTELLTDDAAYAAMAGAVNPYGDGEASSRIADAIACEFELPGARRPIEFHPEAFVRPDGLTRQKAGG